MLSCVVGSQQSDRKEKDVVVFVTVMPTMKLLGKS